MSEPQTRLVSLFERAKGKPFAHSDSNQGAAGSGAGYRGHSPRTKDGRDHGDCSPRMHSRSWRDHGTSARSTGGRKTQ